MSDKKKKKKGIASQFYGNCFEFLRYNKVSTQENRVKHIPPPAEPQFNFDIVMRWVDPVG